jgi:uncharacterized RDD family membrane protein YckC
MKKIALIVSACALLTVSIAAAGQQQTAPEPRQESQPEVITQTRDVVRVGSDYTLKADDETSDLVVVAGTGTVAGRAHDVVIVFGTAEIASTADIRGSLVLIDSNARIAAGARVRQDFTVVGGDLEAPADFAAEGNHVVINNQTLGGRFQGVFAWITHGLIWGRFIVPNLGWVWAAVLVFFIVYLLLNLVFEKPVGEVANMLAIRPLSSFGVGLLVLLLVGPISVLLAVSIIGIAVVPLILCALLVAWIIGKVAGARWIGMSILPVTGENRLQAVATFALGFALITAAYMVPLLGFVTWTMLGVLGLGASTLAFLAAYRRENPLPPLLLPPRPRQNGSISPISQPAEEKMVNSETGSLSLEQTVPTVSSTNPSVVATLPHAGFRDRVAAGVLDLILVMFTYQLVDVFRRGNVFFLLLLIYHIAFWVWKGTTVGGIICQLRVVRVDGSPLQFVDALVRGLSAIFSIVVLGLGIFWILRDPERQAWHDRIAGTYVVKVPRNWPL